MSTSATDTLINSASEPRKYAFLFPGQGAQSVGMAKDFYEQAATVQELFEQFNADITLTDGRPFHQLVFEGPEDVLKKTVYTQPAILAASLAAWSVFTEHCPNISPSFVAGHSLGEYSALAAAGVLSIPDVIRVVKRRAELMDTAPEGAMRVVLGCSESIIQGVLDVILQEGLTPLCIANYNSPEQYVISGSIPAVEKAAEALKSAGAKRVLPIAVSGAFHSELMNTPAKDFAEFLETVSFQAATVPVVMNVDAQVWEAKGDIAQRLSEQMASPVRWISMMKQLFKEQRVNTVIEFGPGTVLTGLIKKLYPEVTLFNISNVETLDSTVSALSEKQATHV
jgi:[acyl-carrier-protein] S-malonyltransferase